MEFVYPIRDTQKINEMRTVLEKRSERDALLFTLGVNTALSITELLKLKISDVIDDKGEVKPFLFMRETTVSNKVKYPLGKNVKQAVKDYLKDYKGTMDRPLFPSRKGNKAISRQQVWHILNEAAQEVGLKERIGNHSLRKTFIYHAYMNGIDLSVLQQMLNHASPKTTLRYIGINPSDKPFFAIELNL